VEGWTAQLNLRLPNFLFLGIFLVGMSLSYSPWIVMWAGISAIVAWSGASRGLRRCRIRF
jgi:adenylate cyclase